MEKVKLCDDCKKENCDRRLTGGICSIGKESSEICKSFNTRDPMLIASEMAKIIGSEKTRYEKALKYEDVGAEETINIIDKNGEIREITKIKTLDNKITALALNILKGGKIVSEIINPQKNPLFQQNNQYNLTLGSVNEINSLPEEEKAKVLKFIDKKLDDGRKDS